MVRIRVWHEGVTLLSVTASDPGGSDGKMDSGDMIRFTFDAPTNEPLVSVRDLLDVVSGSWGSSEVSMTWIGNGTTLLVRLDDPSVTKALLTPGATQFKVRRSAFLQMQGDPLSLPY